jgi:uncharacterized membrane protein
VNAWRREFRRALSGRLWVRSALYGVVALALALAAPPLTNYLPGSLTAWVKPDSLKSLLEIVASSMLLVTTFSLGTMVTAYTAAANLATPRASKVLIDDPISQRVLSTFIGAFVFSIVALMALALGYYDEQGQTLLLFATIVVIGAVVVTLFGWVEYLSNLVRLGSVLNKVETAVERAVSERREAPFMGARPPDAAPDHAPGDTPLGWHDVRVEETGYIAEIDLATLERIADERRGEIRIAALPGKLVGPSVAVAQASFAPGRDEAREMTEAFSVARERSIDQDPRYGLIVLAEIASRALSPGMNDHGTAIGVVSRIERLLVGWAKPLDGRPEVEFPHVVVPPITAEDLCQDAFGPLARDGAPVFEVGVRLQKSLAVLAGTGRADLADAAVRQSERALNTAQAELTLDSDRENLAELAARVRDAAAASRG